MTPDTARSLRLRLAIAGLAGFLGGCAGLRPPDTPAPAFHAIGAVAALAGDADALRNAPRLTAPTLTIAPPAADSGYQSQRMVYMRDGHRLEYFARNEWVDTPARMLGPLLRSAIENGAVFRAVVIAPTSVASDLRLETSIERLHQAFDNGTSRVRFTLRVVLVETATRSVVASRVFDRSEAASSADAAGGVEATHRATRAVLADVARFCATAVAGWSPPTPSAAMRTLPRAPAQPSRPPL